MRWIYGLFFLLVAIGAYGLRDEARAECRILSSAPSYTAGQLKDLTCGTNGALSLGGGPGSATAAAPTLTEGGAGYFSFDLAGNTRVTLGTCFGGDSHCEGDDPDSYLRVRTHTTPSARVTADTQIKASSGWVSHMTCAGTDATATAGTIILYNNTAESGTILQQWDVLAADYHSIQVFPILAPASTGLYLGFTTTNDVACTVFYK